MASVTQAKGGSRGSVPAPPPEESTWCLLGSTAVCGLGEVCPPSEPASLRQALESEACAHRLGVGWIKLGPAHSSLLHPGRTKSFVPSSSPILPYQLQSFTLKRVLKNR